jgi:tetratricopeptide (TPR) repeat protein
MSQPALPAYTTAKQIQRELLEADPDDPIRHRELGDTLNALGNLMKALKRYDEADNEYQQAIELRQRLVELDPNQPDYVRMLANTIMNAGLLEKDRGLHRQKLGEDGEVYFQRARAKIEDAQILRRKLLGRPGDDELKTKRDLAFGHFNLAGFVLSPPGSVEGQQNARKAIDYFEQVFAQASRDLNLQQRLIQSYRLAAEHAKMAMDSEQAQMWLDKAQERAEVLATSNPSVPHYQHDFARILLSLGRLRAQSNDRERALADLKRACDVLEPLAIAHEETTDFRSDLSGAFQDIASIRLERKELQLALDALRSAQKHVSWLTEHDPQEPAHKHELEAIEAQIAQIQ